MFSFIFGCIRIPISSTYHYVRDSSVLSVEVKKMEGLNQFPGTRSLSHPRLKKPLSLCVATLCGNLPLQV